MGDTMWQPLSLHGRNGKRKYLNLVERELFIKASHQLPLQRKAFCLLLAYTGCRISEALQQNRQTLDVLELAVIFETLKQRRRGVFRSVPIPKELMELLLELPDDRFFDFSRTTGWRIVKQVMSNAQIEGFEHTMPKGLRHSFGITHSTAKTPQNLIQRWMGHAKAETTRIYQDAVGVEERAFASATWGSLSDENRKKF